ncbi:serine protease [Luteibacter sp. CQ10]|uniref:serine protease n=1 Tax=Luteibacter sp. CQ10 TaxID=2805821 RepID=UPI0034A2191A
MPKPSWLIPFVAFTGLCSIPASASASASTPQVAGDASLLPSLTAAKYRAVGKLQAASSCTATLVAGSDAPSSTAAALVLTAGHCVGGEFDANEVWVDRAARERWHFTPAYFRDNQAAHRDIAVDRVLYATMKGVDVAVLRLQATYGELAAMGVRPLTLVTRPQSEGLPVELVHVPVNGVADDERFLRLSRCVAGGKASIFEGNRPWYWPTASMTRCAGVAGGSSGAPVLLADTAGVLGVMGTQVDPSLLGCGLNRPCEATNGPAFSREGANYFHPLMAVANALRPDGGWDDSQLDKGDGVAIERSVRWTTRSQVSEGERTVPARWGLRIADGTRWIRYKTGPAATLDCDVADGYGVAMDAAAQPLDRLAVPSPEGVYAMCVIGRHDAGSAWQRAPHATRILRQIDDTPPTAGPMIVPYGKTEDAWLVYGKNRSYETTRLEIKYGPRDATDCRSFEGYFVPRSFWETLPTAKGPWRFCARGWDDAGNASPLTERVFEK